MAKLSREKGKRGEREVSALLRDWGFAARRGQQFSGGGDSPDVVHNIPGVHIEVKRVEQLNLTSALEQAKGDAPDNHLPVVFHKKNRGVWTVSLTADDFLKLMRGVHGPI